MMELGRVSGIQTLTHMYIPVLLEQTGYDLWLEGSLKIGTTELVLTHAHESKGETQRLAPV